MKIAICDDEKEIRESLRNILEEYREPLVQITLKRNASSATAELLFHFLRYEVPLDDIILFHAYLYRSFPDDMYDVYL